MTVIFPSFAQLAPEPVWEDDPEQAEPAEYKRGEMN